MLRWILDVTKMKNASPSSPSYPWATELLRIRNLRIRNYTKVDPPFELTWVKIHMEG